MDQLLPGATGSTTVARYELKQLAVSQHMTMQNLTQDGVWFTAATPLTCFRQASDPLSDFVARRPDDGMRILIQQQPFFAGIAVTRSRHWNFAVCWCPHAAWHHIGSHLASCVFKDGGEMTYTNWLSGSIPDLLALAIATGGNPPARVPVAVLGLRTTTWHHELVEPDASQSWLPLQLVKRSNEN
jgi:hypothetical protein